VDHRRLARPLGFVPFRVLCEKGGPGAYGKWILPPLTKCAKEGAPSVAGLVGRKGAPPAVTSPDELLVARLLLLRCESGQYARLRPEHVVTIEADVIKHGCVRSVAPEGFVPLR